MYYLTTAAGVAAFIVPMSEQEIRALYTATSVAQSFSVAQVRHSVAATLHCRKRPKYSGSDSDSGPESVSGSDSA
jgi:hypothetical protein